MKISIDSAEPLKDAMRVLGALYDVTLTVATSSDGASQTAPASVIPSGDDGSAASGKASTKRSGRTRSKQRRARVSTAEVRSWAQQNGHPVSNRGPIPAAVSAAYLEAQGA